MIVEPLTGKALQAIGHRSSIVALEGSVRSGKTWVSLLDWLKFCRYGPPGPLLMTGRTQRTVIINLVLPLQQWLGKHRVILNRSTGVARILERECMLLGADNEAAVTKIQGRTLAGAYVDEASTLPESYFNMLYSRLSIPGAQLWLTSNPEGPAHWLKTNWLDRASLWIDRDGKEHRQSGDCLDLVRVSFKLEDNPNLPSEYVERIKMAYSGLWYKRYILGEWCIAAGAIYEEWNPERHVVRKLPDVVRLLAVGIDYGTTNPTRGYLLGISGGEDSKLVIMDEWAPTPHLTDAGLSRSFREWLGTRRPEWIVVDPSAASFKLQLFQDGFANVMNGSNAVVAGIRLVASLLATDKLVVSDSCKELINELPSYSWDPKATALGQDAPIKAFDHGPDALRYAIASTQKVWGTSVRVTIREAA